MDGAFLVQVEHLVTFVVVVMSPIIWAIRKIDRTETRIAALEGWIERHERKCSEHHVKIYEKLDSIRADLSEVKGEMRVVPCKD